MMIDQLPWDLELVTPRIEGATSEASYSPATGRLIASLTNTGDAVLRPGEYRLHAEVEFAAAAGWIWIQGRYMQADALVRNFATPAPEGYDGRYVKELDGARRYTSREVATVTLPSQNVPTVLAGCLRPSRFFFDIEVTLNEAETTVTSIDFVFDLRGAEIAPGESLELPPLLVTDGRDPLALMKRFADEVASELQARVPDHVPTGWCSWYYFYNRVTEADILENLDAMARARHPAEYVQIDDGFQNHTGDWLLPNEKFPSGMKTIAEQIRVAGYKPGLWLAPFVLHEDSVALREHPDMVLKTPGDETIFVETWLGRCAILDCTNPESEAWLRNIIRTVVRGWGYVYLKLDALTFAARHGAEVAYHEPGTTAPMNLRRGLEIIRDEAGDQTFILGCTCHFGPAIGLVDAMRVGPDVKELWSNGPNPSVKHAMRLALQRNWMHDRWWANDPDCLIVRDTDTELTEPEVRFLATGIALSGGMVVASDDLPKLSEARREMALALFPPPGAAADPVDPSDGPAPAAWRAELGNGRSLVGVLNWGETSRWVPSSEYLRPGEVAFDVWNARHIGMGDQLLRPHEGTLWQVAAPGPTPRVVGDTGHLTYNTLFQRQVSGRIQVRNDSPRPRTIAIEARGQIFEVDLAPNEMRWFD
jgi:alpha-galactosidase